MESLNQRYAMLNQRVETLFLDKHKYRDIDYIRIMNQLKEKYLKLVGTKEQPKFEMLEEQQVESEESYAEQQVDLEYDSDGYENYYSSY